MNRSDADDFVERVIDRWHRNGVQLRPGVRPDELQAFEQRNQIVLPEDMRALYLRVDGMNPTDWDDRQVRFWPLADIRRASEELEAPLNYQGRVFDCFVFADVLIWSFAYGIELSASKTAPAAIYNVGGEEVVKVADTWSEFIQFYLTLRRP